MVKLMDLLPQPYYQDVHEMKLLMQVEQYQVDELREVIDQSQKNFYALVANERGLEIFEQMLGIDKGRCLDIESRRFNVIAQMLPPKPVTLSSFNAIIQALNINAKISVQDFHVDVKTQTTDGQALQRLNHLLKVYLPANLTFKTLNIGISSTPAPTKRGSGQLVAGQLTNAPDKNKKGRN